MLSWFPVLMRYGGLSGVAFVAVVWLLTERVEPSLLALFGGMMGVGEGVDALRELVAGRSQEQQQSEEPSQELDPPPG
jgi:hypothetical protein